MWTDDGRRTDDGGFPSYKLPRSLRLWGAKNVSYGLDNFLRKYYITCISFVERMFFLFGTLLTTYTSFCVDLTILPYSNGERHFLIVSISLQNKPFFKCIRLYLNIFHFFDRSFGSVTTRIIQKVLSQDAQLFLRIIANLP